MNILLIFGLLIITAYLLGLLLEKAGMPKIIGYIIAGVAFSPNTIDFVGEGFIQAMEPVLNISLAFIAFEVGGELKWNRIKQHKKEILSITFLSAIISYALIASAVYGFVMLFPGTMSNGTTNLLLFALLLGALSAPAAPATTFAVIHQYRARGKVTETILEVVALLDVMGIFLFSLTVASIPFFAPQLNNISGESTIWESFYMIIAAIAIGAAIGYLFLIPDRLFKISREGQWVIILFSLIVLSLGISSLLNMEELLVALTMGLIVTNTCRQQKKIFRILRRYTENLVFLIFFLLSGLHLDVSVIPKATPLIILFVLMRFLGKYSGVRAGASLVHADKKVKKYAFGGVIPQAGITIGLALSIYQKEPVQNISDMLLATIMGATIINELTGPFITRYALKKSGEIHSDQDNVIPGSEPEKKRKPPAERRTAGKSKS